MTSHKLNFFAQNIKCSFKSELLTGEENKQRRKTGNFGEWMYFTLKKEKGFLRCKNHEKYVELLWSFIVPSGETRKNSVSTSFKIHDVRKTFDESQKSSGLG